MAGQPRTGACAGHGDHAGNKGDGGGRAWSSRSLGSRLQHGIFYAVLRAAGLGPGKFILFFVVLYYALAPAIRRRILPYLERRFGPAGRAAMSLRVFRLYWQFGLILLERAAMGILGRALLKEDPESRALISSALSRGKGLIILSAHFGPWQSAPAGLGFAGRTVHLAHKRGGEDIDRHYFEHGGARGGTGRKVCCIDPSGPFGGLVEMRAALQRGDILCLMGDRMSEEGKLPVAVNFLEGEIKIPSMPYFLAAATGSPLLIALNAREKNGEIRCVKAELLDIPPMSSKSAEAARPYAEVFASALESAVAAYPFQFFNFYDLWAESGRPPLSDY